MEGPSVYRTEGWGAKTGEWSDGWGLRVGDGGGGGFDGGVGKPRAKGMGSAMLAARERGSLAGVREENGLFRAVTDEEFQYNSAVFAGNLSSQDVQENYEFEFFQGSPLFEP